MSRKTLENVPKQQTTVFDVDPLECPFREFRDNELQIDAWGLGTAAFRAHIQYVKMAVKAPMDLTKQWDDDQTQPLPRSVRTYLHGWIRAEELARDRWGADVIVFEEEPAGKMVASDMQISHAQVLLRSAFCRKVLSVCYILERVESLIVEHQWENFVCSLTPEGWRAKYHIYSPGLKPGGGAQHKPQLSKNGCYLVRLFYLGVWRCIWVSDQVPVDATGAPLLPFSPMITRPPAPKPGAGKQPPVVMSGVVHIWPLLICKALLKLAAPDMNSDEDTDCVEDELMPEFDILHTLTGSLNLRFDVKNEEELWALLMEEVPIFSWDDDDETVQSTVKSRSTKKPTTKESYVVRRNSMMYIVIKDTGDLPPYYLPGVTPGHEMDLLVTMVRDLPLKKPPPEPDVALWKIYRWVDWARRHGLYDSYECDRTQFLKINGLLKLSHAPHLFDVQSTESITMGFIEEHKSNTVPGKDDDAKKKQERRNKELQRLAAQAANAAIQQTKEELREWIQFLPITSVVKDVHVVYYPSMFEHTSAGSNPPQRVAKIQSAIIVTAPKGSPLYLQIDGPEENVLKMSLRTLNPRILSNCGAPVLDYIEPAHLILEEFEWFKNCYLPMPKAYIRTRGYNTVEVAFSPGRHVCRIWVHSRMNWHMMLLSESTLLLGSRDVIMTASIRECSWASKFLLEVGSAFSVWAKVNRNIQSGLSADREFFRSYLPDLPWDSQKVGYDRSLLHWMFRRALQAHLSKRLHTLDYRAVCTVLRKYFCDPDFGFPDKPKPPKSLRDITKTDVCDCTIPEVEEIECVAEEQLEEQTDQTHEDKPLVSSDFMEKLLTAPKPPVASQVCELATEELPCGILKEEREKIIRRHEAATLLQSHWRGTWARKCLKSHVVFTPETLKFIQENAFGNLEALSKLMNEFFLMFPGAKNAYSVASALSGVYGVMQHSGTTPVTPKCKWIPYFQGVFYCHTPVKVHFDVVSSIPNSTLAVFDNDTGEQLPQAFNAHITFDFQPNFFGFTVMGHGSLSQTPGINYDAHWQLTVLSCIDGAFHLCDNEDPCRELPISHASKLHLDEIFLPNRRNVLGGIQIAVTKHESVSFRVAATSPDLQMEVTLRSISSDGQAKVVSKCSGKGEIYWPFIRLEPAVVPLKAYSTSQRDITMMSARSLNKTKLKSPTIKPRSTTKMKAVTSESKMYSIEAVCPYGWPLTLTQWQKVDEIRNLLESPKIDLSPKKQVVVQKPGSAKDKEKEKEKERPSLPFPVQRPQPGDAYVVLECAVASGGGATVKRDDDRDIEFANARKLWDIMEPNRNYRGAQIRKEFRTEFLEAPPQAPSVSESTPDIIPTYEETEGEDEKKEASASPLLLQGPSPASDSGVLETTLESEEEMCYMTMPEQLRDKFIPLYFLPFCMKEKNEDESVILTPDMAEAAKKDRHARIEAAKERMRELQNYNLASVLARQRSRCLLIEKLCVDSQWPPNLVEVLEARDEAIARETLNRTLSATKKKQEAKKK